MEFRQDVIFNMIDHLNRKSIGECLFKILISYVPDFSDQDVKKKVLLRIFDAFDSSDAEVNTYVY